MVDYGSSLLVGIMAKVLSLMATHSGDRSQYFKSAAEIDDQLSNIEENKGYAGTPYIRCVHAGQCYIKCVHTRSYPVQEVRTPSAHISRQRNSHVGFLMFYPWYLADGIVLLWCRLVVLIHDLRKSFPI
jgi:hypothetical protein